MVFYFTLCKISNMWVEEITLENIKCFEKVTIKLGDAKAAYPWVTLLGENGGGKSTILQALGLLLAGPEGAQQLLTRPVGWLRDEREAGKISTRIHQGEHDPEKFGKEKERRTFGYTYYITGSEKITIRNKVYTEPSVVENKDKILTWLRQNALTSKGKGWFAAGFGAFRRLTRSSQIIVPSLQTPERFSNFLTQYNEDEPLAALERWLVFLDYRIAKEKNKTAEHQKAIGINAINQLLPNGSKFDSITSEGRILFDVGGQKVPTISLSDGYRSALALGGDIIWRLLESYPDSPDPLKEEGTILIDELDIHLHPIWQRDLPQLLRSIFPGLQFIVATHSPLIAAGAGEDATTYRLKTENGKSEVIQIKNIPNYDVDKILQSDAFGLVSTFSPSMEKKLAKYYHLKGKPRLNNNEQKELQLLIPFIQDAIGPEQTDLSRKIDAFLSKELK